MTYKNYIFDCGKVLFDFDRKNHLDVLVGGSEEDKKLVGDVVYSSWDLQDLGMSCEEYYQYCIKKLPLRLHDKVHNLIFHWSDNIFPLEGMEEFIKLLKSKGHKLYLLSNMPEMFTKHHEMIKSLDYFDDLIFSYPLKMAKPDIKIYQYLLDKHHLDPKDCVFIDDNINNVKAGESIGIKGFLFDIHHLDELIKFAKDNKDI